MSTVITLATLFLCLTVVLCLGTLLRYLVLYRFDASRVEEIRLLRQEGLALNQDREE